MRINCQCKIEIDLKKFYHFIFECSRERARELLASLDNWPGFSPFDYKVYMENSFHEESCCNGNSSNNYISKFLHLSWHFDSIRGWFYVVVVVVVIVSYYCACLPTSYSFALFLSSVRTSLIHNLFNRDHRPNYNINILIYILYLQTYWLCEEKCCCKLQRGHCY